MAEKIPATGPDVVVIDDVSKTFTLRKDNSLKERVVTLGRRGREHQETFQSLKNVSFSIAAGSSIALMGPNGSGKSTLLKVIGGIIDPTSGTIHRRGRLAALLELGAGFHPDLSGRDNVYLNASILGLSREETDAKFDSIVAFSEIGDFIDTQVKFYSSGMYVRLAFAVAIHTDPDILLVDEVLAVGDEAFQRKCMDKIREFQREGRTIILVSHSVGQVMDVCDQGVVLRNGEVAFIGSAADAAKAHRDILEGKRQANVAATATEEIEAKPSHVRAIRVMSPAYEVVKDVHPGEDVIIQIDVEHSVALERWYTTFSIDTPNGQQVFGTGVHRLGASHAPVEPGVVTVEYLIPRITFGGGQYFINADVSDQDQKRMDVLWQGCHFFVPMDDRHTGTVYAEARVISAS